MSITETPKAPEPRPSVATKQRKPSFRPEIQGLRSLAVLMVVTYHVWFGRVSGGVDVFLFISAFLMTLQFLGRHDRKQPFALAKHWLHLFRRLLPAAVTVIVATLAVSALVLPPTRWLDLIAQGWASLSYSENRLLQQQAVDYYANDHSLASPFQHFWSLSIQGQVFILWPLIFALAGWTARRYRLSYRPLLAYIFFAIFLGSLGYSIIFTAINQVQAYFDTGARLWEFALGTLVALILPGLRFRRRTRVIMGWVGVLAMLACGIVLDVQGAFPGIAALWPTVAAAMVIVAGQTESAAGIDRFLSAKPLVKLGDISYALYLWHWPLLVLALAWSGKDHAGWLSGSVIILVALALAYLTTRCIEKPWREWKWPEVRKRRAALAIMLAVAVAAVPLSGWSFQLELERRAVEAQKIANNPGSRVLDPAYTAATPAPDASLLPLAADLTKNWVSLDGPCTEEIAPDSRLLKGSCFEQRPSGEPSKRVLVLGDSHAQQWTGAVKPLAAQKNWLLYSILKGACKATPAGLGGSEDCDAFNADVQKEITRQKPDAIIVVGTAAAPSTPAEALTPGFEEMVSGWLDQGIQVAAVRDNPRFSFNMAECVVREGAEAQGCRPAIGDNFPAASPFDTLDMARLPGLSLVDLTDRICTPTECPAVVGNVYVYLDDNHLSAEYAESMADEFAKRLQTAAGWAV
ncbi:acyltransferase family protein [Arthrobacter sp. FW306-07-I]|uniref:acyltransferase family protein n=1 Tax=Arthrobacter sp. FW306-07-I TaxID=2879622 RepID=UPI001F28C664|nr:acyltransferase family protein [Arthrobacter sp. FW306-07-I]UKA74282.1 acyltransferase [Arthrobacter sp. FW306-07-I]